MKKWISMVSTMALMISMLSVMLVPASAESDGATAIAEPPFDVECSLAVDGAYTADVPQYGTVYYAFVPQPSDYYAIDYYAIESTCSADTVVELYDAYGNLLSMDDDSGDDRNFYLSVKLNYGETYYYGVTLYGGAAGTVSFKLYYADYGEELEEYDPTTTEAYETTTTAPIYWETTAPETTTITRTTTTLGLTSTTRNPALSPRLSEDSLLPASASQFTCVSGGDGTVSVSSYNGGYKFESDRGWPAAIFTDPYGYNWITVDSYGEAYLNWNIEVVSGAAAVYIYFAGQDPNDIAYGGSYVSINGLINSDWADEWGNAVQDIPVGKYCGSVPINVLRSYCDYDLLGDNGEMYISGIKVFAVSGKVVVSDLSVSSKQKAPFSNIVGDVTANETNTANLADGTAYYTFTPTVSGYYTVEITNMYCEATWYNRSGNELYSYERYFDAGELYYIGISSYYGDIRTDFVVRRVPFMVEGSLYDGGEYWEYLYDGDMVYYQFTPRVSGVYTIESSGDYDTRAYLYNGAGTQIAYDDDGGSGYNFKLSYNLTAGETYYYGVRLYDSSLSTGFYFQFYSGTSVTTTTTYHVATTPVNPGYNTTHGDRMWADSLLPARAEQFVTRDGGDGTITVSESYYGSGYSFRSNTGWPCAYFSTDDSYDMIETNYNSDDYLYWDFEVKSGATCIIVYFAGQNPEDQAAYGTFVTINGLIDPSCVDSYGNAMWDIPVGKYSGKVSVKDLGYSYDLMGPKGEMLISGFKVFAVSGEVIVNDIWLARGGSGTTTVTKPNYNTTPAYPTTTKGNPTTSAMPQHSSLTVSPVVPSAVCVGSYQPSSNAQTLLPDSAYDFDCRWGGEGYVDVWENGSGYTFRSDCGWPSATYENLYEPSWAKCYINDPDCYLNYDFEVVSGATNIILFFCGQDTDAQVLPGYGETLNYLIDPYNNPLASEATLDLPTGHYRGSIHVSQLGCAENLIYSESGDLSAKDAHFTISALRVFAVGGEIVVNDLSVGSPYADEGYDLPAPSGKDTLYYVVNADGKTVTIVDSYITTPGIRIPSLIDGKKVTAIADFAFAWRDYLYSIEVPSTVTSIGSYAFYGCYNLRRVVLNRGVRTIGDYAFDGCNNLTDLYITGLLDHDIDIGSYNAPVWNANWNVDYAPYKAYPDVPKKAWYYEAVDYVSNYGLITGYASGQFGATDNLQRQDFVVILARIAGADLTKYAGQNGGMKDVKAGSYYAAAVAWAVDNGIITGYQNGNFGVGDTITREQVCTIFYRYLGSPTVYNVENTLGAYPDSARVSSFARDAVAWAIQNGVISGTNGKIAPAVGASRAQIATIVMRMDQNGLLY